MKKKSIVLLVLIVVILFCFAMCDKFFFNKIFTNNEQLSGDVNSQQNLEINNEEFEIDDLEENYNQDNITFINEDMYLVKKYLDSQAIQELIPTNFKKLILDNKVPLSVNGIDYEIALDVDNLVIDNGDGFILTFDYNINISKVNDMEQFKLFKGNDSILLDDFYSHDTLMEYYLNDELSVDKINMNDIDFKFYVSPFEDSTNKDEYLCLMNCNNTVYGNIADIKIFDSSFKDLFSETASSFVPTNIDAGVDAFDERSVFPAEFYKNQIIYISGENINGELIKFDCYSMIIENGKVRKTILDSYKKSFSDNME